MIWHHNPQFHCHGKLKSHICHFVAHRWKKDRQMLGSEGSTKSNGTVNLKLECYLSKEGTNPHFHCYENLLFCCPSLKKIKGRQIDNRKGQKVPQGIYDIVNIKWNIICQRKTEMFTHHKRCQRHKANESNLSKCELTKTNLTHIVMTLTQNSEQSEETTLGTPHDTERRDILIRHQQVSEYRKDGPWNAAEQCHI